jgi:AraC family transcriptional regulator, transcriptional activator of pobA
LTPQLRITVHMVGHSRKRSNLVKLFSGTPLSQFSDTKGTDAPKIASSGRSKTLSIPQAEAAKLRLVPIPRLAAGGRWRVEAMRALSEPVLLWFTRGQGRITIGGITRGYGAHNAIFIPAGMMHGFEVGAQTYGTAIFFGHDHKVDLPDEPLHLRIRDVTPQAELSAVIDNIQRETESDRAGNHKAALHHLGLLGVWLERQSAALSDQSPSLDASRRLARAYADILERGFRSGKGVSEFAHELGVTPTHLTRVCNKTCGRSASDLLHDRVIFEARKLLSETRLPIAQVAETLGFTSAAYFTRAFQLRVGKTPSAFRKAG